MLFPIARIRRFLLKYHIKTVTVDVFDTLLIRKIYPEELQFYQHAKTIGVLLAPLFQKQFSPYFLVSLRKFCRHVHDDVQQDKRRDRETHIEPLFRLMIRLLTEQCTAILSEDQKETLLRDMIREELELEKKSLRPNTRLIALLRQAKSEGKKIYFLSDMYLDRHHLRELLQHFQIDDLFEDGLCSANLHTSKGTGKIFEQIQKKNLLPGLQYTSNLHIGDNLISDVLSPGRAGSHSFYWRTSHHRIVRPLKTLVGILTYHVRRRAYEWRQYKDLKRSLEKSRSELTSHQQILHRVGSTLTPAMIQYFTSLHLYACAGKYPLYFLSSEGKVFEQYFKKLGFTEDIHILPSFNRINTLRAFAHLSLTQPEIRYSQAIIHLFFHGEGKRTLKDLLKSIGIAPEDLGLSELAMHHMPSEKFVKKLIKALKASDHSPLKTTYQKLLNELSQSRMMNHKKIVLGDVGWNGTIQILIEQILQLMKKDTKTMGVYLGLTGLNIFGLEARKNMRGIIYPHLHHEHFQTMLVEEIWEYVLTAKKPKDEKLQWIQKGIDDAITWHQTKGQLTCTDLFRVTKTELRSLLYQPSRKEVLLLGSLEHDAGFGSTKKRALVELTHHPLKLYWLMVKKPEEFQQLYLRQYWERGFLKWYHLQLLQPVINGLRWLKRKNYQIFG